MEQPAFCPRCGTQRQPGMSFCGKCGHDFGPAEDKGYAIIQRPASPPASGWSYAPPAQPATAERFGRVEKIVGVAIVAVLALGAIYWFGRSQVDSIMGQVASSIPTLRPVPTAPPRLGTIWFGADYDPNTLQIVSAFDNFRLSTPEIAWSAQLSEPAGAQHLTLILASKSPAGTEVALWSEELSVTNPAFNTFANKVDFASLVEGQRGTYVVRILRGAKVLAEGTFQLY